MDGASFDKVRVQGRGFSDRAAKFERGPARRFGGFWGFGLSGVSGLGFGVQKFTVWGVVISGLVFRVRS